jgi:hypothetical protein
MASVICDAFGWRFVQAILLPNARRSSWLVRKPEPLRINPYEHGDVGPAVSRRTGRDLNRGRDFLHLAVPYRFAIDPLLRGFPPFG